MNPSKLCLLSFAGILTLWANQVECQQIVPTYQHSDPETGQMLTCDRCPPGTHMVKHCTHQDHTVCAPCSENHYTEFWNYVKKCLYCNIECRENQYIKQECSKTHNKVCECRDGYQFQGDYCLKHSECIPGFGVKIAGTLHEDTICERCPMGFYSSLFSSTERCKRHINCNALGLDLDVPGNRFLDNVCNPCQPGSSKEGLSKCEEIYFYFVSQQKLSSPQIFKLGRILNNLPRTKIVETFGKNHHQKQVLDYLIEWKIQQKQSITVEMLVKALMKRKMKKLARKVAKKFLKNPAVLVQNNRIS